MSVNLKDKLHIWLDDVKDKAFNIFGRDKTEKDNLYETRWVWYHTLLVIEHNMRVIMNLAQKIFCLAHGELLAEGSPEQIKNDKRVINAYLGAQ